MVKSPKQLDHEIDETLLEQQGRRSYTQAHARFGRSDDPRLGAEGARLAAVKAGIPPKQQSLFMRGWLDERGVHAKDRAHYLETNDGPLQKQGRRAYLEEHGRLGDSGDMRLGPTGARRAAIKANVPSLGHDAFMKGWLDVREEHALERAFYGRKPYIPLLLPEFPIPDED